MFDSISFERPPMPPIEPPTDQSEEIAFTSLAHETAPERKTEGLGVTSEQMAEIADFFEKQLENPENKLIPLMANAEENGAWDILALEVNKARGVNFAPEQLKAAMKGGSIFKRAIEVVLEGPKEEKEEDDDSIDIDVDTSEFKKAA